MIDSYDIKLINIKNYDLKTSGYLQHGLEWENEDVKEISDNLQSKIQELDGIMNKHFVLNIEKYNKFVDEIPKIDVSSQSEEIQGKSDSNFFRFVLHP